MTEPSSNTSQTASAFYDPDSSSWRTSQGSLLSEEYPLLERLPDWGTTHGGALCVQATPEHLTGVRDGSVLPNLPTPTANNAKESGTQRDWGGDLTAALLPTPTSQAAKHGPTPDIHANGYGTNLWDLPHLLPTPRAQNGEPRNMKPWIRPLDQPQNLENAIARLLPTPVVNEMGRGKTPEEWDSWTDEMKHRHGNGNGHGPSLAIEAARLLPTPTVQDGANNAGPSQWERNSKPLNVVAVELTMGLTGTLSNDGNGSSDDQHPPQPIAEDCDPSSSSG